MDRQTDPATSSPQTFSVRYLSYQKLALAHVSRTFALTIPLLPDRISQVIGNAYLLCRIADTIEDEPELSHDHKKLFLSRFTEVLHGNALAEPFSSDLTRFLSDATAKGERDLVLNAPDVVIYHTKLPSNQRKPITRCIETMCDGMAEFVSVGKFGLPSMKHLDRYCYVVAGVVGEMITDILCEYSPDIESRRNQLFPLSARFGRGLQLVNILKDHREDYQRGATWLPTKIVKERGDCQNEEILVSTEDRVLHIVNIAKNDLSAAVCYVQLIPAYERRVRKFLAVTLGLAILTLRRIHSNPGFQSGDEVKISRRCVYATVIVTSIAVRSNRALRWLFNLVARF